MSKARNNAATDVPAYPRMAEAFVIDPLRPTRGAGEPESLSTPNAAATPAEATATTPRGTKRARGTRPSTGNRANPTHAPRFNGPAGLNRFDTTCDTLDFATLPKPCRAAWRAAWSGADDSGRVEISHNKLARRAGLGRRATIDAVKRLADMGMMTLLRKGSNLTHDPNIYRLRAEPGDGG